MPRNEACTAVHALWLPGCSTCAQTRRGSSSAARRKAPDTSADVCKRSSRSVWCQWDGSRLGDTRMGSGIEKRASRGGAGGSCVRHHLYHHRNEEGSRKSRQKSFDRRLQRASAAGSCGSRDELTARLQEFACGPTDAGLGDRFHVQMAHLRHSSACNTMPVNAKARRRGAKRHRMGAWAASWLRTTSARSDMALSTTLRSAAAEDEWFRSAARTRATGDASAGARARNGGKPCCHSRGRAGTRLGECRISYHAGVKHLKTL